MTIATMTHETELDRLRAEVARVTAERDAALAAKTELEEKVSRLQEKVSDLIKQLYGRKSEKVTSDEQRELFEQAEAEEKAADLPAPPFAGEAPDGEVPPQGQGSQGAGKKGKKQRREHGWSKLPEKLRRQTVTHTPTEAELHCDRCGLERESIGAPEITERLDYEPASLFVVQHVRPRLRCPCCQDGTVIAPLPPTPIGEDKGRPEAGLLAYLVASKFGDHLPLNRLESILSREGFPLSSSTMCDWLAQLAKHLDPIAEAVCERLLKRHVVGLDDTEIRIVYDRTDRENGTRKGRIWAYRGLNGEVYFTVSDTKEKADKDGPLSVLSGYRGPVQADAASTFDDLFKDGSRIEVGCNAHARRKFFAAKKSHPREAAVALATFKKVYEIEARIRGKSPEERRAVRQAETKPILEAFDAWLDELAASPALEPGTPLAKAVGYARNHRVAQRRFLEDGHLEADNNAVERALRLVAVGRKNWLFAGSKQAALDAATFYTLVASCKELGIEPWQYLRDVIRRLAANPETDPAELAPRAWWEARSAAEAITPAG
jgi:transposase